MLRFYKFSAPDEVIDYTSELLLKHLDRGEKVLWLLSGGSAIDLQIRIAEQLRGDNNLGNLRISLIDERFGPVGQPDSNWQQLMDKGFKLPGARLQPILNGQSIEETAAAFEAFLSAGLAECDFRLGIAGIGPDGHTLGIKPGSPSLKAKSLVSAYDWDDYRRITSTAEVIKELDQIIVYAAGPEKKQQLLNLQEDLPAEKQPAQLLKLAPKAIIFNDSLGEKQAA